MAERIPYVLTIDVEPDERTYDPAQQPRWRGFETLLPEMTRFRALLAKATGAPVQFTWMFRCDQQVAHTYGSPTWGLEQYRDEIARLRAAGDEIGVHTHAWRWDSTLGDWIADHGDPSWVRHCILESLTAFRRATGRRARAFTHGDRFATNDTIRTLDRAGIAWELTLEPGRRPAPQMRAGEHATGALPDLRIAPRLPYRPSPKDILQPGVWRRRRLWMIPVATGILPNPLTGSNKPACQTLLIGAPFSVMRQVFEGYLACSPLPVVVSTGRSDVLLNEFNAEQLSEFLHYLAEHPRRRELAFETPHGAITRFRAALAARGYSRGDHARLALASRYGMEPLPKRKSIPLPPSSPELLTRELTAERAFSRGLQHAAASLRREVSELEASRLGRCRRYWRRLQSTCRALLGARTAGLFHDLADAASAAGRTQLRNLAKRAFRAAYLHLESEPVLIVRKAELASLHPVPGLDPYEAWMAKHSPRESDLAECRERIVDLRRRPVFSVLLPVFNPTAKFLREALDSVIAQVYPYWQLCIADDASTDPAVRATIAAYAARDPRIVVARHSSNRHISVATNTALALATGEFCGLFDHDDLLAPDALFRMAVALDREPDLDVLYSDEDKVDEHGHRCEPHFKPEYCPDTLLAGNYICHFLVARTALLREVGGMREGYEGAQDFDLVLRLAERTQPIRHVPRVLYHWRKHAASTASASNGVKAYAYVAGERAVSDALRRRAVAGTAQAHPEATGHYIIRYPLPEPLRVSAIITARDQPEQLRTCVESLLERTDHRDLSVLVVDHDSREPATFELFRDFADRYGDRFATRRESGPFNMSRLINRGVAATQGDIVLLLSSEIEILDGEWLTLMLEHAQQETVGCVGAQLRDPDGTIQHGGVIVGGEFSAQPAFRGASRGAYGLGNRLRSVSNFSAVSGACLLVRRAVYDEVRGLDEAFGVSFGDIDFCLRVRRAGYWNLMVPHATLTHHRYPSGSLPFSVRERSRRHDREAALFRARWPAAIVRDPCLSVYLRPDNGDLRIAG